MDTKNTSSKITEIIEKIVGLEAVERHYQSVSAEFKKEVMRKEQIEQQLVKELNDVTKLEKLSLTSMFHKVLGDKNEQLEKERQEYLQVTLQHKEVLNSIEVLEFEMSVLEKKVVSIDKLKEELEILKTQREKEIMATDGPIRNELIVIYNKIDANNRHIQELKEAFVIGQKSHKSLDFVSKNLQMARDWGFRDGNRAYLNALKHSAIDKAMGEVSRARYLLAEFNKELVDVNYEVNRLGLQMDNISKFPSVIFDNLISDWILQNKIRGAINSVSNLQDDVVMILNSLKTEIDDTVLVISQLNVEKDSFLERN